MEEHLPTGKTAAHAPAHERVSLGGFQVGEKAELHSGERLGQLRCDSPHSDGIRMGVLAISMALLVVMLVALRANLAASTVPEALAGSKPASASWPQAQCPRQDSNLRPAA